MDLYETIRTRRSVRAYRPDPVPEESLKRVLEAARVAPSGSNRQPWKFIVIRDPQMKEKIAGACGGQSFIAQAPIVIVACGRDIDYNRGGYMDRYSMLVDVSIALTHLILAARAEGLGTCWIGFFENERVKGLLGVPSGWDVVGVTPLGYPQGDPFSARSSRKGPEEVVCEGSFKD